MFDLQKKTNELLSAYRELTGTDYTPSLPEFLELRRQAIEECRIGLEKTVTPSVSMAAAEKRPQAKVPRLATTSTITTPVHEVQEEKKERSGFAILSELADPWN